MIKKTPVLPKVVVLETEKTIVDLIRMLLAKRGLSVFHTGDPSEGLALIRRERPELVILDMVSPDTCGLDVCRKVRGDQSLSDVKIIGMTAIYKRLKFKYEAKDGLVDAFVEKPFDVNEFLSVVARFIYNKPSGENTRRTVDEAAKEIKEEAVDFRKQLPSKIKHIQKLWSRYSSSELGSSKLSDIQKLVHSVNGCAVLYGFPDVGRMTSRVAHILSAIGENRGAIIQTQAIEINELLSQLSEKLEAQSAEQSRSPSIDKGRQRKIWPRNKRIIIVSGAPGRLEHVVADLKSFGYRAQTMGFRELANDNLAEKVGHVVVDLRQSPPNALWRRVFEDETVKTSVRLFAIVDNAGAVEGMGARDTWLDWTFLQSSFDAFHLVQAIEAYNQPDDRPFRVLIAMHNMPMAEHFQILLQSGGFATAILGGEDRTQLMVEEFKPDVVLFDEGQSIHESLSVTKGLRKHMGETPLVLISEPGNERHLPELLEAGITDVIAPGLAGERLAISLASHAAWCRKIHTRLTTDPVSGASLFSIFMNFLETELKWASKGSRPVAVGIVGLDNVTSLNRQFGVYAVDRALACMARLIREFIDTGECVGKMGGTGFVFCFPKMDIKTASLRVEAMQKQFSVLRCVFGGKPVKLTFSAGLSQYPNLTEPTLLVEAAKRAMHRARAAGGDSMVVTL